MEDARQALKKLNMLMYIMFALIAVGAIMIFIGVMKGILALWIIGIVVMFLFLVFGVPLVWVRNSERRTNLRIAVFILGYDDCTIEMISGSCGISVNEAWGKVKWALNAGYLPGYVINGTHVCLAKLLDPNLQEHAVECPNCGASFTYVGKIGQCPYCGDYYPPQNKKN
jgi:hypothetical protein